MMRFQFRVRSVLLSRNSSAVTLEPVQWIRDDPSGKTEEIDGETVPASVDCEPADEGAEPFDLGGKMTELRFESEVELKPDDYVTVSLEKIELA